MSKFSEHMKKNKTVYIVGGVCLAAGALGATIFSNRETLKNVAIVLGNNNVVTQTNELIRRGHPGFIVKCVETGEQFASIRRTSEMMGVNRMELTKHLKGLQDSVGGFTFEILGEASA